MKHPTNDKSVASNHLCFETAKGRSYDPISPVSYEFCNLPRLGRGILLLWQTLISSGNWKVLFHCVLCFLLQSPERYVA